MSRPPIPRTHRAVPGAPDAAAQTIDYHPLEHAELVALQRGLAEEVSGLTRPDADGGFAATLMDLSALAGHVLGLYQDRYASEAFLRTASSPRSLARHGRSLGYEPTPPVSATGYLALTAKGDAGVVPRGLAVSSAPSGSAPPQDYETLADIEVSPARNRLAPRDARVPWGAEAPEWLELQGLKTGLAPGEKIVLDPGALASPTVHTLLEVREVSARKVTRITVEPPFPVCPEAHEVTLYAHPRGRTSLFGSEVPATEATDEELRTTASDPPAPTSIGEVSIGWRVSPAHDANDVYLRDVLKEDLAGDVVVRAVNGVMVALRVTRAATVHATFERHTLDAVTVPVEAPAPAPPGTLTTVTHLVPRRFAVSRQVTALQLEPGEDRSSQVPRATEFLYGWRTKVTALWTRPNPAPANGELVVTREPEGLGPGMFIALVPAAHVADAEPEIARVIRVQSATPEPGTRIAWQVVSPYGPSRPWAVGDLELLGNVVPISHGRSIEEALGGSDGVTRYLRFTLRHAPVTTLPSALGAAPVLEVFVDGVRWERVADFEDSAPHERHHVTLRDEGGALTVMFGDGVRGMIPPSGDGHITARYRVGAGAAGNVAARSITQLRRAHPRVDKAVNPRAMTGGADAAAPREVRAGATRYLRTFDRAVSTEDHANLALLYPGVAKARAAWGALPGRAPLSGVVLVVADAQGDAPVLDAELGSLERFMDARRDASIPLSIRGPRRLELHAEVAVGNDPAVNRERVLRAVREALCGASPDAPGLFSFAGRELGQPAFLSEVHARVERVAGVTHVRVQHLALRPASEGHRVADTVTPRPEEWLSLLPANLDLVPMETL